MKNRETIEKVIRWCSFGMLCITATMIFWAILFGGMFINIEITDLKEKTIGIYHANCIMCVASIVLQITYLIVHNYGRRTKDIKDSIRNFFKKEWPCLVLIIFMAWTAVGCIRAGMEANAENNIREAYKAYEAGEIKSEDELYKIIKNDIEIANWSEDTRASNAADRAWNGCANLKDGYFSFMFYATVFSNVLLLGYNSQDLKKWLLRIMMVSMIIVIFLTLLNYLNNHFLSGIIAYKRAIFHNSNHYGYYLCIATILCATLCLKDKNWYFKGLGLQGYTMSVYMLILNNTFGSILAVMVATLGILIYSIANTIVSTSENKKKEGYLISLSNLGTIGEIILAVIMSTVLIVCSATMYEKQSNGERKEKSIVAYNFEKLGQDIKSLMSYFMSEKDTENTSGELVNGTTNNEANSEVNDEVNNEANNEEEIDLSTIGSGRGEVWVGVFKLIKQKPFFGWGLENLLQAFYNQLKINEGRTHNLILQLMGTTGIPGMLLYMTAVLAIFFRHFNLKRWREWNMLEFVTIFCFISYMVSSMFGNSAFYTSPYFMIILGILTTSTWVVEEDKKTKKKRGKNK